MLTGGSDTHPVRAGIDRKTAFHLASVNGKELHELFALAGRTRAHFRGNTVDLCSIVNARSGACPEDCSFCAQSARSKTDSPVYPLVDGKTIMHAAESSAAKGVRRFCIVTSGKQPDREDLDRICDYVRELRRKGLSPCVTLGLLDRDDLFRLKNAGLHRYHHNLETSEAFFSQVCSTHTYGQKIETIEAAKSLGLSICSGGIFGMGETWEDRVEMAFALRDLDVDSVPVNFLTPIPGTPLEKRALLSPLEALKIVAIYRLILPDREIRICGGRTTTLRDLNSHIFSAGADGLLMGNYLTTSGRDPDEDVRMINDLGLNI